MTASIRALFRSKFLRNVAVLMTGTAVAQVILLLAAPVLSRIFSPEAFGVFNLFAAVSAVIIPIVHLSYGPALVLPKEDSEAGSLFSLANGIVLAVSALSLVVFAVGHDAIAGWLNAPDLAGWLWWMPAFLLLVGVCEVLEYWATRRKNFWSISTRRVVRSVVQVGVQIPTGAAGWGAGGLVTGTLIGQFAEVITLGFQVMRRDARLLLNSCHILGIKKVAVEYKMFPLYGAPGNLLNSVSQSIPTFMLSAFFGTGLVGLYGMAMRVLVYPSALLTGSLRQVLFQRAAETEAQGMSNLPMFRKTTLWLAAIAVVPTIAIMIVGPRLFSVVLGAEWQEAGVYARWLVLWVGCMMVNVPALAALQVLKRQKLMMVFDGVLIAARAAALLIAGALGSAEVAVAAYAGVGAVFNIALIAGTDVILRREHRASTGSGPAEAGSKTTS
jgi:lipopolysaccharide exporter